MSHVSRADFSSPPGPLLPAASSSSLEQQHQQQQQPPPAKVRRIAKACIQCRVRKQRCEGPSSARDPRSSCRRCIGLDTACSFATTPVECEAEVSRAEQAARAVARLQKHVAEQDRRIARLEEVLTMTRDSGAAAHPPSASGPGEELLHSGHAEVDVSAASSSGSAASESPYSGMSMEHGPPLDSVDLDTPMSTLHRLRSQGKDLDGDRRRRGREEGLTVLLDDDPVALGILTPEEAQQAFDAFWEYCNPCAPVLCPHSHRSAALVRSQCLPLFTSVCVIGSRRFDLATAGAKKYSLLVSLLDRALSRLLLRPRRSDVHLDHIRCMLLYVQWMPTDRPDAAIRPSRYNDVSAWGVLGLAIRYALLLGLHRDAVAPFHRDDSGYVPPGGEADGPAGQGDYRHQNHRRQGDNEEHRRHSSSSVTRADIARLRVWINILTCDANLMLSSGLPASVNPEPVVAVSRRFAGHALASRPDDTRAAAIAELVAVLKRASRSSGRPDVRALDPASLRQANADFDGWEAAWQPALGDGLRHCQLPFTALRAYRLSVNSACLAPIMSASSSSSASDSFPPSSPNGIEYSLHTLQALDISLLAAAQTLYALSEQSSWQTWPTRAAALSRFPDAALTPDPDALRRFSYSVDSSWITHSFAAVFLVFCYTRGLVDEDLKILALAGAARGTTYPAKPSQGSLLFRLIALAFDIFDQLCLGTSLAHPASEHKALLSNVLSAILKDPPTTDMGTSVSESLPMFSLPSVDMDSYTTNGLTVRPINADASFGAEVSGVDWTISPLPVDIIQTLVALQDRYAVIVFRATGLDNDRQVQFASQLGKLEVNPAWGGTERVGTPYLFDVSNLEADGSVVKKGTRRWAHSLGNALWHTDSSFNQHRSKYSILLAHQVPGAGTANTEFADTRQAWLDLPEDRKAALREIVVEHELWHSRRLASPDIYAEPTAEERSKKPSAFHSLVQEAPKNGTQTLFLAAHAKTLHTRDGRALPDSQQIIWDLIGHCTQPQYTFAFEWRDPGDMVWWDNRQSMHRASPYDENMGARDVRRATIFDDGPAAHGVAKPTAEVKAAAPAAAADPLLHTLGMGVAALFRYHSYDHLSKYHASGPSLREVCTAALVAFVSHGSYHFRGFSSC
ncbi:hypothetical protein GGR56DRAFT_668055 [Xylariaceae sp. FL0804]|nr:hypothetical protein GGR56DRAFT_668055 [Xylariaceae sp. FL0804]